MTLTFYLATLGTVDVEERMSTKREREAVSLFIILCSLCPSVRKFAFVHSGLREKKKYEA